MQQARMLGNFADQTAQALGLTTLEISKKLQCSEQKVKAFFKGRTYFTFQQLNSLSDLLGIPVQELLKGDPNHYYKSVVHCMNNFDDIQNRETILDIIDDYMDIYDSIE